MLAVEWGRGIDEAWADVTDFVPRFVAFVIILVVGYFVAKMLAKGTDAVLERVGFDEAVERGGVSRALEGSRYDASDIVSKTVHLALLLFILQLAFGVFGDNAVSDLITGMISYLPKVFAAIVIVVVAAVIAAAVKDIVEGALSGLSYGRGLATAASATILTVAVFAALSQLQIAPAIVNGLFYALLAIVVGSAVVAIGGGGIQPMRAKWEQVLGRMQQESDALRREVEGSGPRRRRQAERPPPSGPTRPAEPESSRPPQPLADRVVDEPVVDPEAVEQVVEEPAADETVVDAPPEPTDDTLDQVPGEGPDQLPEEDADASPDPFRPPSSGRSAQVIEPLAEQDRPRGTRFE